MNPLRDWSTELPQMLARQEPESLHLEYKARGALLIGPSTNRERRAKAISKDVSAFLNSDGGTVVYGIRETSGEPKLPVPFDPHEDGFTPEEMTKEDLENLITSNIQNRPSPDLFCVTVVDMDGRFIFVVDLSKSYQGVFQAKDKRYYKRFNFKSEPMEHYEIEDVRMRADSPDIGLTLGLTDTWESEVFREMKYQVQQEEVTIHVGLVNRGQVVAETALVELGVDRRNQPKGLADPFAYAKDRIIWIGGRKDEVPWYRCRWTPQNLGRLYTPLFAAVDPEYLSSFSLIIPQGNYSGGLMKGTTLALICWRVQAPHMMPVTGIYTLKYFLSNLYIEPDPRVLQVGSATA